MYHVHSLKKQQNRPTAYRGKSLFKKLLSNHLVVLLLNYSGDMTSETRAVYQSNLFCMHTRGLFFLFQVGVIAGITDYAEKPRVGIPG